MAPIIVRSAGSCWIVPPSGGYIYSNSRLTAFKSDDVLQENIIIVLERGGKQKAVTISNSTDDLFADLTTHRHPFDWIVLPNDPEYFIHVPTSTSGMRSSSRPPFAIRWLIWD